MKRRIQTALSRAKTCGTLRSGRFASVLLVSAFGLSACGPAPVPQGFADPHEANNRQTHEINRAIDRTVLRPLSGGYGTSIPAPVKQGVQNFAQNLDAPGDVVNNLLQGRPGPALQNTLRFALNTTIGIGGLFDPATAMGVAGKPTDFGETLHVWGAGEGDYIEVLLLGPTTERDLFGAVVDLGLNPLRYVLPADQANVPTIAKFASRLGDRARYSETVDSVLYDSADSYAQARLSYLQNRRYELGQTAGDTGDEAFVDPYEDPYGN